MVVFLLRLKNLYITVQQPQVIYALSCFSYCLCAFIAPCKGESDSDGIQTHDLRNRKPALYSAKLRSQCLCKINVIFLDNKIIAILNPILISR